MDSGVGVFSTIFENKPQVVVVVSNDLNIIGIHAGKLSKEIGKFMGGGGGGKPHLATSGGKNKDNLMPAIKKGLKLAKRMIMEN